MRTTPGVRARVGVWAAAWTEGNAGEWCDRIVRERPVPDRLLMALADPRRVERGPSERPLTAREREVVRAVGAGLRYRAVAELLGVAPQTVMSHTRRIREKLGAANMAHAYAIAHRTGQLA